MQNYIVYKINKGDTLQSIANMFKVSTQSITKQNKDLQVGDRVIIDLTPKTIHIVSPGETISSIATKYGKSCQELIKNNNIKRLFIGQRLQI